jgi:hypothetical protein
VAPVLVREFILNEIETKSLVASTGTTSNSKKSNKQQQQQQISQPSTPQPLTPLREESIGSVTTETSTAALSEAVATNIPSLDEILNVDEEFEPTLINYIIRQMINDPDQELSGAMQIINVLKLFIDSENMLSENMRSISNVIHSFYFSLYILLCLYCRFYL